MGEEKASGIIGIMATDISNPYYAALVQECERAADERGYMISLSISLNDINKEYGQLEKFQRHNVDAIIQLGGKVDELVTDVSYADRVNCTANRIPMITTGRLDGADCYKVNIDVVLAIELAAEYLIGLGHEHISYVGGCGAVKSTVDKQRRFRQMLRRHGIAMRGDCVMESGGYDEESGYRAMLQLIATGNYPTAVIAVNDLTAAGILHAITDSGLSVPGDISLISFDDTYVADLMIPRLTSISYNYKAFGEKLIEVAIEAIEGRASTYQYFMEPTLIIRESCAPLKV